MNEKLVDCGVRENYKRGYKTLSVNVRVDRIGFSKKGSYKKKRTMLRIYNKGKRRKYIFPRARLVYTPYIFGDIIHWFDRLGN